MPAISTIDPDRSRLGVTVSRRIGNAVVRNRVKRRVRECFRKVLRDRTAAAHLDSRDRSRRCRLARLASHQRRARDGGAKSERTNQRVRMMRSIAGHPARLIGSALRRSRRFSRYIARQSRRCSMLSTALPAASSRAARNTRAPQSPNTESFAAVRRRSWRIARCNPLGGHGFDPVLPLPSGEVDVSPRAAGEGARIHLDACALTRAVCATSPDGRGISIRN